MLEVHAFSQRTAPGPHRRAGSQLARVGPCPRGFKPEQTCLLACFRSPSHTRSGTDNSLPTPTPRRRTLYLYRPRTCRPASPAPRSPHPERAPSSTQQIISMLKLSRVFCYFSFREKQFLKVRAAPIESQPDSCVERTCAPVSRRPRIRRAQPWGTASTSSCRARAARAA